MVPSWNNSSVQRACSAGRGSSTRNLSDTIHVLKILHKRSLVKQDFCGEHWGISLCSMGWWMRPERWPKTTPGSDWNLKPGSTKWDQKIVLSSW